MKKLLFTTIGFIMIFSSIAFCQDSIQGPKRILAGLKVFLNKNITEKAYLQFDKPFYAAGDTIYFKAYVTAGEVHKLSTISGVLHVDLINIKDKIDQSIKLPLDSGVTSGDFALPDTLPAGNYIIRAYTQWMRNDGEKDFFDKVIPVGSLKDNRVPESLVKQPVPASLRPDIQFLPEGGGLATGILSKVAFKVVGGNGLGIEVKGTVVDNDGKEITSFTSAHLGMGYFYIAPAEGKSYKAELNYPNGLKDIADLPKPETSGLILSINNDSLPKASVTIEANNEYYRRNKNKAYTLVIYSGGVVTTVNCKLDSQVIKLDILKRKLHTGIATVTLFSPENEPLSERLLFIQNYDQLGLNVNSDKNSYIQREKVNIKINAINRKGSPVEGNFSVSVIDESKVPEDKKNGGNIINYLLLTSDLKGYVEQPDYYFGDTSEAARENLDILMLAQGYRRFEWKQVLQNSEKPDAYQAENGIEVKGQIKNPLNKPIANGTVTLIPSNDGQFLSSTSDKEGMFRFSNLLFTDTVHFILSAVNSKGKNSTKITYYNDKDNEPVIVGSPQQTEQQVASIAMTAYVNNDKLQQQELLNHGKVKGIMLKEVKIKDKKLDDEYRTQSLAGAGNADQVMHADEIEKIGGQLSTSLNGRLRGVIFVNGIPYLSGLSGNGFTSVPMLVIIDGEIMNGFPHSPPPDINLITSSSVETIEVLKSGNVSIYGSSGGNGVLIITTKQGGGLNQKDIASVGILNIAPVGFYKAREFYSPKYENPNLNNKQHDFRSTIYWNPEIKTDKEGNASFDYYNADGTGTYKVVIEGIDNNGNIGRQVYRYKVE